MVFSIVSGVIAFIALLLLIVASKLLLRSGWLFGWIRGMVGLVFIVLTLAFALTAYDVLSYRQLSQPQHLATISFKQLAKQEFEAALVLTDGSEKNYTLKGDQWQMDARLIKWPDIVGFSQIKPAYRMDRIQGRYYSIDQQQQAGQTVFALERSPYLDAWLLLNRYGRNLNLIRMTYGSATYQPMADGAVFKVSLSQHGLVSEPFNDLARDAVVRWQ